MEKEQHQNSSSGSTTWDWRKVKIRQAPEAEGRVERSESLRSLLGWPIRRPMTIRVKYRGGAECWWELHARGRMIRRPGSLALHDVLREFYGGTID